MSILVIESDEIIYTKYPRILKISGLVLLLTSSVNASINPTLYFITNRQYRHEFTVTMRRLLSTRKHLNTDYDLQVVNNPKGAKVLSKL